MCAALELNARMIRPGKWVAFWKKDGASKLVWAGFARSESLKWWERNGGELVDVPADRFAERSNVTKELGWDAVPDGKVVRGLVERNGGSPVLKIVTRASTDSELQQFQHERMPLMEPPLYSGDREGLPEIEEPAEVKIAPVAKTKQHDNQLELF